MGAGAVPLMAGGMALSAYGNWQSGQTNSNILKMNADLARKQEAIALENGEYGAGVRDLRGTLTSGADAVSYASQGVVSGAGSAGSVVTANEAMTEADKNMTRINARRQAFGLEVSALNDEYQARMAKRAGNLGAASSVVSGAGNIAFTESMLSSNSPQPAYGGGGY